LIAAVRHWVSSTSEGFYVSALLIGFCLLLGGGTRAGFLSDVLLQGLSIPLLLFSLWRLRDLRFTGQVFFALLFCAAVVLVPALQLIPLPPSVWTALPNREPIRSAFDLLQDDVPWMPLSISARATWLSALSLLPPIAVFLAMLQLGYRERRLLSLVVLGLGTISVFVGLAQVAQGPQSALRFFEITNASEAVGFFANRNHFAALLYALILFAAAWAVTAAASFELRSSRHDTARMLALAASFTLLVVLLAAQAMARSRAGLGLTIIALFGAFALAFSDRRTTSGVTPAKLLTGAIALAALFAVQYALYRMLQRFPEDPLQDARVVFARNTLAAAQAFMPFGSGMGTFAPVYAMFEKPRDALLDTYANRAHNDLLELWLEAGIAALALIAVFLSWLLTRSVKIWRRKAFHGGDIDHALARAATLAIALLIIHSLVDYPLRTGAMMAMLAFACGLLVAPPGVVESESFAVAEEAAPRGATAAVSTTSAQPLPGLAAASPGQPKRWGEGVAWPEEWRHERGRRAVEETPRRPARKPTDA
jgi:O-antigen ligase